MLKFWDIQIDISQLKANLSAKFRIWLEQVKLYTILKNYVGEIQYVVNGDSGYWIDLEKWRFEVVKHTDSYYKTSSIPKWLILVFLKWLVYYIFKLKYVGKLLYVVYMRICISYKLYNF